KRVSTVSDKESATDTVDCDEVLDSHNDANDDEYDNGEILEYDDNTTNMNMTMCMNLKI
uniref:Uncharacterized protein n=1 Tax=Amphimedon queenslandica TaxID=400682 RepID=A0A1X7U3W5_AMPQE